MKSPETTATVIQLPRAWLRRRDELELLPAALDIIETPASPAGRAIAGTIIAFLCIAITWATFGQINIIATTQGGSFRAGNRRSFSLWKRGL